MPSSWKLLQLESPKRKNMSHQMKKKLLQCLKNSPFVLSICIAFIWSPGWIHRSKAKCSTDHDSYYFSHIVTNQGFPDWNVPGRFQIIVKVPVFFTCGDSLMQRVNEWSYSREKFRLASISYSTPDGEYEKPLRVRAHSSLLTWEHSREMSFWNSLNFFCLSFHPLMSHHSELI